MNSNEPLDPEKVEEATKAHEQRSDLNSRDRSDVLCRALRSARSVMSAPGAEESAERADAETPPPLPPELKEWALQQATEQELLAGLKEVQEKGGTELGEVIQKLQRRRIDHGTPSP